MTRLNFNILLVLFAVPALAASTAVDDLFQTMPEPPMEVCLATSAAKDDFHGAVFDYDRRLQDESARLRREAKNIRKGDEKRIREELTAQGVAPPSGVDRKKMRSMSKEERLAMAQQMMAQPGVMNMAAARRSSAEAGIDASREQRELIERINAREKQGRAKLDAFLGTQSALAQEAEDGELLPLRKELHRLDGGTIGYSEEERKGWPAAERKAWQDQQAEIARLKKQLRVAAERHCARFGPAYRDAMAEYRKAILVGRADYDQLDRLQGSLEEVAAGSKLDPIGIGHSALEAVQRYMKALASPDVYRFDQRLAEDQEGAAGR